MHDPAAPHAANGVQNPEVRHERTDANVNALIIFGVGFVVFAVIVHVVLWYMLVGLDRREAANDPPLPAVAKERPRFPQDLDKIPEPRLQTADKVDMQQLLKRDNARLYGYGWVDEKKGLVHVPINTTLERLADPTAAAAAGLKTATRKKDEK